MSFILLILFWISFLIFNFSYLFSVLFLGFLVMMMGLIFFANFMYVKYLIILVYVSGVVVFILYISCMCWLNTEKFSKMFLFLGFVNFYLYDVGFFSKFSDVGEFLWMYMFFAFLFNSLVMSYSLNLFKISGSLRL